VLDTPALFATACGNVGSSIYYALGLTAAFALGLTPIVFIIAGVVFSATAATGDLRGRNGVMVASAKAQAA
jgi:APA family basic amino acid/polyamine antiporter